jgi:hypothetical protein
MGNQYPEKMNPKMLVCWHGLVSRLVVRSVG